MDKAELANLVSGLGELYNTQDDRAELHDLAAELIRLKVDVIITPGSNDTRAAKNATKTIPIVFLSAVSDPVTLGLVDSLARPGGNVAPTAGSSGSARERPPRSSCSPPPAGRSPGWLPDWPPG